MDNLQPIDIRNNYIEAVSEFQYLGSVLEVHGKILKDLEERIVRVSIAFGVLHRPVFQDSSSSLKAERKEYHAWECCCMEQRHG